MNPVPAMPLTRDRPIGTVAFIGQRLGRDQRSASPPTSLTLNVPPRVLPKAGRPEHKDL
jgi:hypothetical protein